MKRFLLLTLCAIVIAGCGGGGGGHHTGNLQVVDLPSYDLVYNPVNQMIYASAPNSSSVVAINPVSGAVAGSIAVGGYPMKLALSDDGQVLYVGVDDAVLKIDPIAMTAGPSYTLGDLGPDSPYCAIDLAVSPGQPGTIAVARGSFSRYVDGGVAIYDDGVQRPNVAGNGNLYYMSVIAYSYQSTLIYGYDNLLTGSNYSKVEITPDGAEITDQLDNWDSGHAVDMKYDSGLIYASSGDVVDPDAMTLVGRFPASGLVEPDVANGSVYFLTRDQLSGAYTLRAFDPQTFVQVSSLEIGELSGELRSLIRCGTDGLAIGTSEKVYLVHTAALH